MQNFCIAYRGILSKHELYATGTTGRLIEEAANLNVHKFLAGHLGGEQQMCAMIEQNQMDLVIFLRDPLNPKSHEPDIHKAIRLCDMHNIPLASNVALSPPDGKLDASGSPLISSLPENSIIIFPSLSG